MSDGLHYTLDLADPDRHLIGVTVRIPAAGLGDTVDVVLPAWCPGSYMIRDYARMVRDLAATGDDGAPRAARKVDKSTWRVDRGGARELTVRYQVYGHELTVRTNHVDDSHAFVHGPATFVFVEALRAAPVGLEVRLPAGRGWHLATGLERTDPGPEAPFGRRADQVALTAASVDALFDAPLHAGPGETRRFTAGGVPFELALWGERAAGGLFTVDDLVTDLTAIVDDHAARLGGPVPFPHYTFMLMLAHDAYGGLEHRNSSANLNHPQALATRKHYEGVLELLSHEFFHVWNGKRIAPPVLLDFDYGREAYTRCLWVVEGLTSHYDRWALRTSGRITARSFLDKLLDDWTRLQATPGRRRHSLEDSSFDAWIKLYKPDESNLNTTVSYYLKGGLVATALDLEIRRRTEGGRSLDDVLRALWRDYGAEGRGYPEDVQGIFEAAAGLSLGDVFTRQVRGTADPDLAGELAAVGLELRASWDPAQLTDGATAVWIGATTYPGTARIAGVLDGGPAEAAGLSPLDELIAVDDQRVGSDVDVRTLLALRRPGDRAELTLFRRNRLRRLTVTVAEAPPTRFEIVGAADLAAGADDGRAARYRAWMGEPHPGPGPLAGITTSGRWL